MKVIKWLVIAVVGLFAIILIFGLAMSDQDKFKYEAERLVEAQVGDDANVNSIQVYDHGSGDMTACGSVSYRPKFAGAMGLAGPISSQFFVQKNGVVLIGTGEFIGVVGDAQANGCTLKAHQS